MENQNISVLLVDDDSIFRRFLAHRIKNISPDIEIVEADDGLKAIELFNSRKFNVVLLDIFMPNCDGPEALAKFRSSGEAKIIFITAGPSEKSLEQAIALGASNYISKSTSKENIDILLRAALDRRLNLPRKQ